MKKAIYERISIIYTHTIKLPKEIKILSRIFTSNGYELFIVGGAVRDSLIKRKVNDYDFATNATPTQMLEFLHKNNFKIFTIGAKYGTISVIINKIVCEITTFRSDGDYKNHRHPQNVDFINDIHTDLSRRDFSINALCYNIEKRYIIDDFNGTKDIKNKVICSINNPSIRFKEDALRILRIFSLHSKLNFNIEDSTLKEAILQKKLLEQISAQRIINEIYKIMSGKQPRNTLKLMQTYEILRIKKIPKNINKIPINLRYFIVPYIFDLPYLQYKPLLNLEIHRTCKRRKIALKKAILKFGFDVTKYSVLISSSLNKHHRLNKKILKNTLQKEVKLKIDGNDLKGLGIYGKKIRELKEYLIDIALDNKTINNKKVLMQIARDYLRKSTRDI